MDIKQILQNPGITTRCQAVESMLNIEKILVQRRKFPVRLGCCYMMQKESQFMKTWSLFFHEESSYGGLFISNYNKGENVNMRVQF